MHQLFKVIINGDEGIGPMDTTIEAPADASGWAFREDWRDGSPHVTCIGDSETPLVTHAIQIQRCFRESDQTHPTFDIAGRTFIGTAKCPNGDWLIATRS